MKKNVLLKFIGLFLLFAVTFQKAEASYYINDSIPNNVFLDISYLNETYPEDSVAKYRWYWNEIDQFPINFEIVNGSEDITDGSDFTNITNALSTWSNVSGSSIRGTFNANDDTNWSSGNDENEIGWIESASEWNSIGLTNPSNTIGVALTWYNPYSNIQLETDILLNGVNFNWVSHSDTNSSTQLVEHIVLHELGHAFSLKDLYNVSDANRTMYGYTSYLNQNDITLDDYDKLSIAYAYPAVTPEPISSILFIFGGTILALGFFKKKN